MTAIWSQLVFPNLTTEEVDHWSEQLEQLGAVAVTLTPCEPVFDEPGVTESSSWQRAELSALFACGVGSLSERLHRELAEFPSHQLLEIVDRDWTDAWREHFPPRRFAERLWVCPIDTPLEAEGLPVVRLDPGAAFGTGRHPTTALCLAALCEVIGPATRELIDYGCGSGILAIAAAKLGVPRILAVDIDPAALDVARANITLNQVAPQIFATDPQELPEHQADVLVANILLQPLVLLAPHFARLLRPGGAVILSGVLHDQAEACLAAYRPMFNMQAPRFEGDWALLCGTRHD